MLLAAATYAIAKSDLQSRASALAAAGLTAKLSACCQRRAGAHHPALRASQGSLDTFAVGEVERSWQEAEALGKPVEEIANACALLCCVHRQLGYYAALHEGAVGTGSVVSRAPSLPLVLSWEGPGGVDEIYGMSLSTGEGATLLQTLLGCVKRAAGDRRYGLPQDPSGKELRAKVSLLRQFVDITEKPTDWTVGQHGLWYTRAGGESSESRTCVYPPEVVKRVAGDDPNLSPMSAWAKLRKAFLARTEDEEEEEEAESSAASDSDTSALPVGRLYRFEALEGVYQVSSLPTMRSRQVIEEHDRAQLLAQARIKPMDRMGLTGTSPQFAVLTSGGNDARVRAFVVPPEGTYGRAELSFADGLTESPPAGLDQVRRVFVLAPIWDCYIDGCGLPERRCAWYGQMPLDLVVLERLRTSQAFSELSVEQDERERAIESLMPLVQNSLEPGQDFTLVPIYVGGLVSQKAERYSKLLAPYINDPANLFIVAGDVESLGDLDLQRPIELTDGPQRFMREVSTKDQQTPVFSALELFLAMLGQTPKEQLALNRYW